MTFHRINFPIPDHLSALLKEGYFDIAQRKIKLVVYWDGDIVIGDYFSRNLNERIWIATNCEIPVKVEYAHETPEAPLGQYLKQVADDLYGTAKGTHFYEPLFDDGPTSWEIMSFKSVTYSFFQAVAKACADILNPKPT